MFEKRVAWLEPYRLRGLLLVGLALATSSCVPIPYPSTVRVDEPSAIQPATLSEPAPSEILACVGRSLAEGRADVRIAEAGPVWNALSSDSKEPISIGAMLADEGACGQMESDRIDYLITVQHAQGYGATQGGINAVVYGMPHGPVWGFGHVDHGMLAVVYKPTGEVCARVRATARERAGLANIGPLLPGPWLIVFPVGDPSQKACGALGEALSETLPASADGASVSVVLFEAGPPPDPTLSPWPGEQPPRGSPDR